MESSTAIREQRKERARLILLKRKRQCERRFYEFAIDAFEVLHPGQTLQTNWHIKYLCDRLQKEVERILAGLPRERHIIINVPPRTLKSLITTVFLPSWAWVIEPRLKFINSSYSGELATSHSQDGRRILESDWFKSNWGDRVSFSSDQNQKTRYQNTQLGERRITSTGGTITGAGGDIIVVDDPLNPNQAASDAERKKANTHFDLTLSSRLNNPKTGLFIVIMQRLHEEDLTGHLLRQNPEGWEHICIPAELSSDVRPEALKANYVDGLLFPARFDAKFLAEQRIALGSYGFAGQMMQRPAPDEGGMIKKAWFGKFKMADLPAETVWQFVADTAYTADQARDPSVILAYAYHENRFYIRTVGIQRHEWNEVIKWIPNFCHANGYTHRSRVSVEPKSTGKSIVQALRVTELNIREAENPTKDKQARVNDIIPTIEAGKVLLLHDEGGRPDTWVEPFLVEVGQFPNGIHDDQVDCLVMMVSEHIKKRGMLAFGIR